MLDTQTTVTGHILDLRIGKVAFLGASGLRSAIAKTTIHDRLDVGLNGLAGDEQAESFHGGRDKAILHYDFDHYARWRAEIPERAERFVAGSFGENLVATGLSEDTVCIADRFRVGTTILEVSEPRQPCFKLNHRFDLASMSRKVQGSGRTGWYYRVIEPGWIAAGESMHLVDRPNPGWTVRRLQRALYADVDNFDAAAELTTLPGLSEGFRTLFRRRLEERRVENWEDRLWNGPLQREPRRWFRARVDAIDPEPGRTRVFTLSLPDGETFPAYEPGAHIEVKIDNSVSRLYSLISRADTGVLRFAVRRAPESRGGSAYLHERVSVGDWLQISEPQNGFPLARTAASHVFIAGGIGITPFLPMIDELARDGVRWDLHYCVRGLDEAPFLNALTRLPRSCVTVHDSRAPGGRLDIVPLVANLPEGAHLYVCGSGGLVEAVETAAAALPPDRLHVERFGGAPLGASGSAFTAVLKDSGKTIDVSAAVTLLEALRAAGHDLPSSCETGICGSCQVGYTSGKVDHRDRCLTTAERQTRLTTCVSRAVTREITLEL